MVSRTETKVEIRVYWSFNSSHVFGFHSRANRWASAICWGVIWSATVSRASAYDFALVQLALDAARFNHLCAWP